jgi:hypothetical protein
MHAMNKANWLARSGESPSRVAAVCDRRQSFSIPAEPGEGAPCKSLCRNLSDLPLTAERLRKLAGDNAPLEPKMNTVAEQRRISIPTYSTLFGAGALSWMFRIPRFKKLPNEPIFSPSPLPPIQPLSTLRNPNSHLPTFQPIPHHLTWQPVERRP